MKPWLAPASTPPSPLHAGLTVLAVATMLYTSVVQARIPGSTAVIALCALAFTRAEWSLAGPWPLRLWAGFPAVVRGYLRRPGYWLPALLPLAYLLALAWSADPWFGARHVRIASVCLGVPLATFALRGVLLRYRRALGWAFVAFATVAALAAAGYVLLNQEALIVALGKGRAVPTPIGHTRFSATLAFAVLAALSLAASAGELSPKPELRRGLALACALALAAGLHVIAVRTGLVVLYAGLALAGARWLLGRVSPWVALPLLAAGIAGAAALATRVPSVARKLAYTQYDLEQLRAGDAATYSDASRLLSARAALDIIGDSPLTGAPRGLLREEMTARYHAMGHPEAHHLPTNQYLFSWALAGLPGLVGAVAALFGALWRRRWWRVPLLAESCVLSGLIALAETPLAADQGAAFTMLAIYLAGLTAVDADADAAAAAA